MSKRKLLIGVVLMAGAYAGGVATGYYALDKPESSKQETVVTENGDVVEPASEEEALKPQRDIFEEYKKQIDSGSVTDEIEKETLYINAAFAGAFIDAPEAKEYAQQALSMMSEEDKAGSLNRQLVSDLEKIAAGNYDQVSVPTN